MSESAFATFSHETDIIDAKSMEGGRLIKNDMSRSQSCRFRRLWGCLPFNRKPKSAQPFEVSSFIYVTAEK